MSKMLCVCSRPIFGEGLVLIEGAFQNDGSCAIAASLAELETSQNDSEQDRYFDLEARFEALSLHGSLEQPKQFRSLDTPEGLWEIKTAADRVGCYRANHSEINAQTIRLTHLWDKDSNKTNTGKTPMKQKNFGDKIIREDRAHDNQRVINR